MPNRIPFYKPPRLKARTASEKEREQFYNRAPWKKLRAAFLAQNPLCGHCLKERKVTPATIAHHKVERLDDADVAYDMGNLEALCQSCHTRLHKGTGGDGKV